MKPAVDVDYLLDHVRLVAYSSDDDVAAEALENAKRIIELLTDNEIDERLE